MIFFAGLSKLQSWGNGRDVKNIAKDICSDAFAGNTSSGLTVSVADILRHLDKKFKSQKVRNEIRKDSLSPDNLFKSDALSTLTQGPPKAPTNATSIISKTNTAESVPPDEGGLHGESNLEGFAGSSPQRDPGVSDEVWQQLQRKIAEERVLKQADEVFIAAQQHEYEAQGEAEEARLEDIRRLEEEKCLAN